MFCPKCKAEYRAGFTMCSDCIIPLVNKLPEEPQNIPAELVDIYSPNDEVELSLIKGILDAEGIDYFVKNDTFGSMKVGPSIELFNKKTITVRDDQYERARHLIKDYLYNTKDEGRHQEGSYSLFDKVRMGIEVILFGWLMPGKKRKSTRHDN